MRLSQQKLAFKDEYKIMLVDDDKGIVDSLSAFLTRSGYDVSGVSSPVEGLEELKRSKYDLLILDYLMPLIKGDEFVSRLREFDRELYVILLTGHADLAPPLDTIKALDIHAYCEKSPRLDQLLLLIESGIKSIKQMKDLRKKSDELTAAYSTLKSSYIETIEALRIAVDTKDVYTRGHSDRVSKYARLIGEKLGMSAEDLETLHIGGLFHDIGKIGLSDDILLKDSTLSEQEYIEMKKHPLKGMAILSAVSAFAQAMNIVGGHHERWDGSGYPNRLAGGQIPLGARIISVADAFDAMVSDRQYRKKMSKAHAINQLLQGRGTQFDKDIVDCFIGINQENPELINGILENKD